MLRRTTRTLLGNAAAAFDRAVNVTAISGPGTPVVHDAEDALARLRELRDRYQSLGAYESFFRAPRALRPIERTRAEKPGGLRIVDLAWPSEYEPFLEELRHKYRLYAENQTAAARLIVHDEPRPMAILVHGYLGGVHRYERRVWPLDFFRRIGMDVALFVLPHHGSRASDRPLGVPPPFPGSDPRMTNEGFRQAMGDLRDLVGWLLGRGHPHVGVMGMSLGGFTSALLATLEPRLAFAVPIIPLASVADLAKRQGKLGRTRRDVERMLAALEPIYQLTSPLHRSAVISSRAIRIIGGEADQITPIAHARLLATHFGCRIETWKGGHLLQVGRGEKFRNIGRFLNELGVIRRQSVD